MARQEELERIAEERLRSEREGARVERWDLIRTGLQCVGFCVLGLVIMFFGFSVTDLQIGRALLWAGMAIGYAGMAYTLLSAYIRGEERGDW